MKKLGLVLVLLLAFMAVTVSGQDVAREDTVIFDIDGAEGAIGNFTQFNPFLPASRSNSGLSQGVLEPLFILNYENGEIQPWLAESMVANEDSSVWTLNLREGAHWSDGEAFNADDVVYTIEMLMDPDNVGLSRAASIQQFVESVEKVDDLTVVFTLLIPNPRFKLDNFSVRIGGSLNIQPEHIWRDEDPQTFTNFDLERGLPIGTGPYTITSANETEFVYDRDENWWGAETGTFPMPEPLRLIWIVTGNDQIRVTLAGNNELDSVMDITLGAFEALQASNPNIIAWFDAMPWVWLDPCPRRMSINHTVAPWDNPNMRRMLNFATDRNEVIAIAYEGVTIPSRSIFVEYGGMFPYIDAMEAAGVTLSASADLDAAEAILAEEGYERNSDGFWELDGEVLSIVIQAHEGFIEKRRITADLVEQYQRFGIDASASIIAGATWNDNKYLGNFEATTDWEACGSVNEPWQSMDRYDGQWWAPIGERSPGQSNISRWSGPNNERYSEIIAEIGVLPLGDPAITDMVVEAMTLWYEDMVDLPLNQATKLIPFNTTYWTNWPTAENNYNHPATWWNSTHQIIQNLHKAE